MAVQDDLRRLSQMDSIYLGESRQGGAGTLTSWHKGRLQQANDSSWIFRSISQEGAIVGFQLGSATPDWSSNEFPATGVAVTIPISQIIGIPNSQPIQIYFGFVFLQQQLPGELTN